MVQYAHAAADELAADIGERRGKQVGRHLHENILCDQLNIDVEIEEH